MTTRLRCESQDLQLGHAQHRQTQIVKLSDVGGRVPNGIGPSWWEQGMW